MDRVREVSSGDADQERYRLRKQLDAVAKTIFVPTNDDLVRHQLRQLGLPVEIGAESRSDRRQRLRQFRAEEKLRQGENDSEASSQLASKKRALPQREPTDASPALVKARESLAKSFRIEKAETRASVFATELYASQTGFSRPVSALKFLDADRVVVGDYAGTLTVLDLANEMQFISKDSGRNRGRIGGLTAINNAVVSGDLSGACHLWTASDGLDWTQTFPGDGARITDVDFHYTGSWFVSAANNRNWSLWDVNDTVPLQVQESGVGGLQCCRISADGCLVAAGGDGNFVGLWDLRNGISFANLVGHSDEVLAMAWHPDPGQSYTLLTAAADNRCLVWDLRHPQEPVHTIYAHTNAITGIAFDGRQLVTTSLDESVRIWNGEDYSLIRRFPSGTKMTCVDVCNGKIVAGRWDRQVDMYI